MKEFLVYTAARFAVFAVCVLVAFGLFWALSGGDEVPVLWALLLGAVLSVMISAWLLRDLREKFVLRVQQRAERSVAAHRERTDETSAEQ